MRNILVTLLALFLAVNISSANFYVHRSPEQQQQRKDKKNKKRRKHHIKKHKKEVEHRLHRQDK